MASLNLGEVRDVSGSPSSLRPIWGNSGRFTSKGVNGALLLNWSLVGETSLRPAWQRESNVGGI